MIEWVKMVAWAEFVNVGLILVAVGIYELVRSLTAPKSPSRLSVTVRRQIDEVLAGVARLEGTKMEEKTTQERIHKGFEDMRRWIDEAETVGQLLYRLNAALEALSGENKVDFHYFRDMSRLNGETKNDQ